MEVDAARAVRELRELAALTGDAEGAQRVAWTPMWTRARQWLLDRLAEIPDVAVHRDDAGNLWAESPVAADRTIIVGSHLDSVPNGGWLDGALGVVAGLEVLRGFAPADRHAGVRLVDWADEEGARFGRSLLGSSGLAGTLDVETARALRDADGVRLVDVLAAHRVDLDRMGEALDELDGAFAYLELHIEQGPVLEGLGLPLGAVLGTFGVERHRLTFTGRHAHAGSTPMGARADAFLAAARTALAARDDARARVDVRATTGTVFVSPGIVTAFNGACTISLDQRALDPTVLAEMVAAVREHSEQIAREEGCSVAWTPVWSIEPIPFDPPLIDTVGEVIGELTGGRSPRLPSGALHDAAEMARLLPSAMIFVRSRGGISHHRLEDSDEADLVLAVRALFGTAKLALERLSTPP